MPSPLEILKELEAVFIRQGWAPPPRWHEGHPSKIGIYWVQDMTGRVFLVEWFADNGHMSQDKIYGRELQGGLSLFGRLIIDPKEIHSYSDPFTHP